MATVEAPIHDNVKQAIVAASELDTRLIMRPLRNTERVLTNEAVERVLATETEKGPDPAAFFKNTWLYTLKYNL